jgi:hypothetical protein
MRSKMMLLLGAGYPILILLSTLVMSFCINKTETSICTKLIGNIQSIWTLWIICTVLVLLMLVMGKKDRRERKN